MAGKDLADIRDLGLAADLEREGYEARYITILMPAFHNLATGEWSATAWHQGQPCVTFSAKSFEEVAAIYERHERGDTSLCGEGSLPERRKLAARNADRRVREAAESAAWRELNALADAGDLAAEDEVRSRAGAQAGQATPVYDRLLDKHRLGLNSLPRS